MRSLTIGDAMIAADGRPSGFDYLRLALSLAVFIVHSASTSYGETAGVALREGVTRPFVLAILPMFFALSGFLVAGSMLRCQTLIKFLGLRVIRIYPALAVEVLLSALIIGPLVTTLPLGSYFTDPQLLRYLVNVTGHISFFLPGVFADTPIPAIVNLQLWTVPYELYCYIFLGVLIFIGGRGDRRIILAGTAVLIAAYATAMYLPQILRFTEAMMIGVPLIIAFAVGVTIHAYRENIPCNFGLFAATSVLAIVFFGFFKDGYWAGSIAVAYVTVYLGLTNMRRVGIIKSADYSYGIFLYGFVIQQLIMHLFPAAREWYWNILICLPLTVAFAAFSWHWVEKPAMKLKATVDWAERLALSFGRKPRET